jgi:Putative endonuclease segE, GIY-YIG domain
MKYGHWEYLDNINITDYIGFVYKITNLTNQKKYIGKKLLIFSKTLPPLKGRVNKRRGTKESDWRTYTGSCNQLNEDIEKIGKDKFTFEILSWCKNKSDLSYEEIKQIIFANALFDKDYYNEYVGGRVRIRKG